MIITCLKTNIGEFGIFFCLGRGDYGTTLGRLTLASKSLYGRVLISVYILKWSKILQNYIKVHRCVGWIVWHTYLHLGPVAGGALPHHELRKSEKLGHFSQKNVLAPPIDMCMPPGLPTVQQRIKKKTFLKVFISCLHWKLGMNSNLIQSYYVTVI